MSVLAAIPTPPFGGIELGPLNLRMYGVVIAVGAYIALRMTVRRYAAGGGDPDVAEKTALLGLLGGFLGARIGYVIPRFLGDGGFIERPLDIFAIWQGGLAFFGGLVGGALVVILYLRSKQVAVAPMADAMAPALPLAQAFGRWGNYFNQELFGRPTDLPWGLRVDPGPAERAGFPGESTFHPTFLYESLWNLALVWLILDLDRRGMLRRRGSLIFVYLIGYGIGRGWIEALRVDTVERYVGLSRNNWIAIAVVLIGIAGLIWWERRPTAPLRYDPDAETVEASLPVDGIATPDELASSEGEPTVSGSATSGVEGSPEPDRGPRTSAADARPDPVDGPTDAPGTGPTDGPGEDPTDGPGEGPTEGTDGARTETPDPDDGTDSPADADGRSTPSDPDGRPDPRP